MESTPLFEPRWQSRRVIVTGAGGFIGWHLARRLSTLGAHVSAVGKRPADATDDCEWFDLDLADFDAVERFVLGEQPEFIIHLAARANRANTPEAVHVAYRSVLLPALHVAFAAQSLTHRPRMIFFGSCDEYGDNPSPWNEEQPAKPLTPYALAKAAVTHTLLEMSAHSNLRVTVVRPSVVYGPGQRPTMFIPEAMQALLSGKVFEMTTGEQTRDFVFVDDVIEAVLRIADTSETEGEVINVASGNSLMIRDIATSIARHCNAEHLLRIGVKPLRESEVGSYAVSIDKLKRLLDWTPPTTLEEGLMQTLKFFTNSEERTP